MAAPYILARTFAEAHTFAQVDLGLDPGYYRVVNGSGTLKAVRGVNLYLVPGWQNRFDRFAMQSALRWSRMIVIDVAEERAKAPDLEPDGLDPAGVQLTLDDMDAHAFVIVEEPSPEKAQEPAPENRRRRRCKDCGLLVEPDDLETHAAEHLPEGV